ncbi:MAG: phosphatidylglycerophosphatase A [Alphaproteobacteria bacterium]|nr:phosphatidylglycerophosphatase A [Alphaproteobacteria bacterium]
MTAAFLVATVGGLGRLPIAPGTWGSAAAALAAWPIVAFGGTPALLVATAVLTPIAVWAAGHHGATLGIQDPSEIVIDEVVGQWLALLTVPPTLTWFVVAFLLFRLLDIVKPWPIGWADRRIGGGIGVVADDAFAGVIAALVLWLVVEVTG